MADLEEASEYRFEGLAYDFEVLAGSIQIWADSTTVRIPSEGEFVQKRMLAHAQLHVTITETTHTPVRRVWALHHAQIADVGTIELRKRSDVESTLTIAVARLPRASVFRARFGDSADIRAYYAERNTLFQAVARCLIQWISDDLPRPLAVTRPVAGGRPTDKPNRYARKRFAAGATPADIRDDYHQRWQAIAPEVHRDTIETKLTSVYKNWKAAEKRRKDKRL